MSDILLVLRQRIKECPDAPVSFYDEEGRVLTDDFGDCKFVSIGELFFHKDAPTSFMSKRGSGPHYTVEAAAFLFSSPLNRTIPFTEYLQTTRKMSVAAVSLVDRKDFIAYVEGSIDFSPCLDPAAPLAASARSLEEAKGLLTAKVVEPSFAENYMSEPLEVITKPIRTSNSIFRTDKDFSNVLEMSRAIFKPAEVEKSQPISLIESIKQANVSTKASLAAKKTSHPPIIIVPAAPTAVITLYNVKAFLEDGMFVLTSDAKARLTSAKPTSVTIKRSCEKGKIRSYQAIDNPSRLTIEEWSRVVAVFVHGPSWQFKGWKWENPVDLFQHGTSVYLFIFLHFVVCGFYLYFDDSAPDTNAVSWNVNKLVVNRSRRHLDATASLKFWEIFDRRNPKM